MAVAKMKEAAAVLLMVMMLVLAIGAKPLVTSGDEPLREVALAAGLPESEAVRDADTEAASAAPTDMAGATDAVHATETDPVAAPSPVVQAGDAVKPVDALPASEAGRLVQGLALKAIPLPDIPSNASAPPQIKRLPDSGMVCLTFDDGFSASSIKIILGCLREHDVQCTFFIIGTCLKLYPELWRQAVDDGHEIAYHTMNHRPLTRRTNAQIVDDINEWNLTAASVLGVGYRIRKIARAPGGTTDARVRRLFDSLGYSLIYWSCDTFTGVYRRNHGNAGAKAASYILRHAAVGAISLQHFNAYDAASVSRYIGEMKARFRLGTVSEALAAAEKHAQKKALAETFGQSKA